MARGRKAKRGGATQSQQQATVTKTIVESVEMQSEEAVMDAPIPEGATDVSDVAIAEEVEGDATEAPSETGKNEEEKAGGSIDALKKDRKRSRNRKGKKPSPGDNSTPKADKSVDFAGLIFMCSSKTKKDCFKYHVFGLPEAKKNLVEQVKKGMKLFLYDIDKKALHGVYKAVSEGGINLVEEAFKDSDRKFPAQVKFSIQKDCMPLDESVFKAAIKENYFRGRFKCELSTEQVGRLVKLFRPLDSRGLPEPKPSKEAKRDLTPRGKRGPPPRSDRNQGPPHRFSAFAPPREPTFRDYAPPVYPRERHLPEILPPSYASEVARAEAELLRQRYLRQIQEEALERRAHLLDPVLEASIARKRYLEDVYPSEQALVAKRPLLSDTLYRELEYQREAPYRAYANGLPSVSAGALPYDPRGY